MFKSASMPGEVLVRSITKNSTPNAAGFVVMKMDSECDRCRGLSESGAGGAD